MVGQLVNKNLKMMPFSVWSSTSEFPAIYGSGICIRGYDWSGYTIFYGVASPYGYKSYSGLYDLTTNTVSWHEIDNEEAKELKNINSGKILIVQHGKRVDVMFNLYMFVYADHTNGVITSGLPVPVNAPIYIPAFNTSDTQYRVLVNANGELKLLKQSAAVLTSNVDYVVCNFSYYTS